MPIDSPDEKPPPHLRILDGGRTPKVRWRMKLKGSKPYAARMRKLRRAQEPPAAPVAAEPESVATDPRDVLGNALAAITAAPELSDVFLSVIAQEVRYAKRFQQVPDQQEAGLALIEAAIRRGMPALVAAGAVHRGFWRADALSGKIV